MNFRKRARPRRPARPRLQVQTKIPPAVLRAKLSAPDWDDRLAALDAELASEGKPASEPEPPPSPAA